MEELTCVQRQVLASLQRRADLGEAPPTYRDLCKEFGWSSTGSARDHLRALARKGFIELGGGRARLVKLSDLMPIVRIPILGEVAAGTPTPAEEDIEGRVPIPVNWLSRPTAEAFALRVHGDSMIGAGIEDGDLVVVQRQSTAKHGDIVTVTVGSETTLKRLYRRKHRIALIAENPAYEDIEIKELELVVHGIAVGLLRRFSSIRQPRMAVDTSLRKQAPPYGRGAYGR